MNKTKLLLLFALPLMLISGCIEGQAVINLNKNGSGKVDLEGLFDYAAYSKTNDILPGRTEAFFLGQLKTMLSDSNFAAWNDVQWKILANSKCYFKGTAYFNDINQTDFYAGAFNSNLKFALNNEDKPTLELKYSPAGKPAAKNLLSTLNVNLIVTVPGKIENEEDFKPLDLQTAMLNISGDNYFQTSGKLVFASDGNDLFDYATETAKANWESEKIIERITNRLKEINIGRTPEKIAIETFNYKMRQAYAAELQKKYSDAMAIYEKVANDPNANEKFRAAAEYQIGLCYLKMGERDKAEAQFEYIINKYPMQRTSALKSVKILREIRLGLMGVKEQAKESPFVAYTSPELYSDNVDPNLSAIRITFSQPMKKTEWFYSSYKQGRLPAPNGVPAFDPCGVEWTLPVKLQPGKVYALTVNFSEKDRKNLQTGFRSVSGLQCEKFVLLFATLNKDDEPTEIDDEFIDECEKINYPQ